MYSSSWYVLHVSPNQEKKVAKHLAIRSVDHYLPLYTERSRWSDRTVVLERPLFSGYVFVRYSYASRLTILSTPGVIRILGNGPVDTVSSEDLDKIRTSLASEDILRPHPNLTIGTRVRVCAGVFEGALGIVSELRQRCKVVLELAAVKQSFSLELDRNDIELHPTGKNQIHPITTQSVPIIHSSDKVVKMNGQILCQPQLRPAQTETPLRASLSHRSGR